MLYNFKFSKLTFCYSIDSNWHVFYSNSDGDLYKDYKLEVANGNLNYYVAFISLHKICWKRI